MAQENKGKKIGLLGKINIAIFVAAAIVLALCYFTTTNSVDDVITEEIEPYSVARLSDGSKEYFFKLVDYDYHYSGIAFYTSHQEVTAYNMGREIYSFNKTGGFWTSSPGSSYHFVEINEKMVQIAVIVKPTYDIVANQKLTFYIGSSYGMYDHLMTTSMPRFFVSLLIVFLSLLLFIYYAVMHEKQNLSRELLYLGYFSFFCGIWSINETDVSSLLMNNKIVDSLIPYFCLMLVVPSMIMFFDSYLGIKSVFLRKLIIGYSVVQTVVLSVLHFAKIAEYRETLVYTQVLLMITAVYLIVGMVGQIIRRNFSRRLEICAAGLSLFVFALFVDIAQYYRALGDADEVGRYVFFIFVFMLAWDMIKEANEILEKGRRAKQLEVFALTDSMTGLYNRNAFERQTKVEAEKGSNLDGLIAVIADANGLKKCNDTYGHEAGDEYITIVAELFNSVYGKYGNCYRTGGDEFCCIIPAGRHINMERLKKLFMAKVYTANLEGDQVFEIGVAVGDAKYDAKLDRDVRALLKRADASMYENKRELKAAIS